MENAASIEEYFEKHPPRTLKEARAKIEEIIGHKRSLPQIWKFLKRIKFRRRKVKAVPGKALTPEKQQEQKEFVDKELTPRLEEAAKGEREIFYGCRALRPPSVFRICIVKRAIVYCFSFRA